MNSLKEAFSMQNLLKNLNFFGELNLGLILTAVGIVYFKNPNHFAFGGTSGLSILLADLFPKINVGGFMWIINLVLVVLGFVFLGVKCMGWTIYSSFALSFFVSVCEWLYPSGVSMSGDAMLDLVFAVFLLLEKGIPGLRRLPKGLSNAYVMLVVVLSFVLFNASNLSQAGQDLSGMLGLSGLPLVTAESLYQLKSFAVLFLLGILGATPWPKKWGEAMAQKAPWLDAAAMLALLLVCTAYLVDGSFNPFLYFRF